MIKVKVINKSNNALPQYETNGSAGLDLRAFLNEPVTLHPLKRAIIPTGLFMELPGGYEAQVRPRSGLAAKKGVTVLNAPGTIDSDYRGEIKVILINLSDETLTINSGDRIAQMVVAPVTQINWDNSELLVETERGEGGFGHTGHH